MERASGKGRNTGNVVARAGASCTWRSIPTAMRFSPSELTTNDVGDLSMTEPLLGQVPGVIVLSRRMGPTMPRRFSAPSRNVSRNRLRRLLFLHVHRCAEPSCRQNAQPARPTSSDHPGEGTAGLAEGGGLRETFTRGNRDVSLQDPDRSHAARSHTHDAENGSSAGLLREQSDDPMRMSVSQRV